MESENLYNCIKGFAMLLIFLLFFPSLSYFKTFFNFSNRAQQAPLVTRADVDQATKPNLETVRDTGAGCSQQTATSGTKVGAAGAPLLGNGGSGHSEHPEYGGSRGNPKVRGD
jgi:hypothetical protein